jgi:hypothetical protein
MGKRVIWMERLKGRIIIAHMFWCCQAPLTMPGMKIGGGEINKNPLNPPLQKGEIIFPHNAIISKNQSQTGVPYDT